MFCKTIILSNSENLNTNAPKGILTLSKEGNAIKGKIRLYNIISLPVGTKIGLYINEKVHISALTKKPHHYEFDLDGNIDITQSIYCALIDNSNHDKKVLLEGGSFNGFYFTDSPFDAVLEARDEELEQTIDNALLNTENCEQCDCSNCEYKHYFYNHYSNENSTTDIVDDKENDKEQIQENIEPSLEIINQLDNEKDNIENNADIDNVLNENTNNILSEDVNSILTEEIGNSLNENSDTLDKNIENDLIKSDSSPTHNISNNSSVESEVDEDNPSNVIDSFQSQVVEKLQDELFENISNINCNIDNINVDIYEEKYIKSIQEAQQILDNSPSDLSGASVDAINSTVYTPKIVSNSSENSVPYNDNDLSSITPEENTKEVLNSENKSSRQEEQNKTEFLNDIIYQLDEMFTRYPEDEVLNSIIPNSRFISVNTDKPYVLGVIYEDKQLRYIAYGVPAQYNSLPPADLGQHYQWLPLNPRDVMSDGYFMIYQDAVNGTLVEINFEE